MKATVTVQRLHQNGKMHSFMDTDEKWWGMGINKPKFDEGDTISFEFEKNGKFSNVDPKSIEIDAESEVADSKPATKTKSSYAQKDDYWVQKAELDVLTQREIRWAGSRNSAIALMDLLVKYEIIPLAKAKGDKEEVFMQYLNSYTQGFYAETTAARDITDAQALSESLMNTPEQGGMIDDDLERLR